MAKGERLELGDNRAYIETL